MELRQKRDISADCVVSRQKVDPLEKRFQQSLKWHNLILVGVFRFVLVLFSFLSFFRSPFWTEMQTDLKLQSKNIVINKLCDGEYVVSAY